MFSINLKSQDYQPDIFDSYDKETIKEWNKYYSKFNSFSQQLKSDPDTVYVKLHFIRQTDGSGQQCNLTDIESEFDFMNPIYSNAGIYLKLCDEIDYIDDDFFFDYDHDSEYELLFAQHYQSRCINLYIANTLTSNGRTVGGFGYGLGGSGDAVVMDYDLIGNNVTITHEFGHVFHLYHTHGKWSFPDSECSTDIWDDAIIPDECWCKGMVNDGGDINSDGIIDGLQTGDNVEDTPAEPNLYIDSLLDGCNYIGYQTDCFGDYFQPVVGNFMSYGPCDDHFTTGQFAKMRFSLETYGLHLLGTSCGMHQDTVMVLNADNSGINSLRWAMDVADHQTEKTVINFNIPGTGPHIIYIEKYLPIVETPFVVNGLSQPEGNVVIDGSLITDDNNWGFLFDTDSVEINGLTIQNVYVGLYDYYGNNYVVFKDLKVKDIGSTSLYIKDSYDVDVINCEFSESQNMGVYAVTSNHLNFFGNSFHNISSVGLYLSGCDSVTVGNEGSSNANEFYSNDQFGLYLNNACNNITILNNYLGVSKNFDPDLGNYYYGLYVGSSENIQIGNDSIANYFYNNGSYGFRVDNSNDVNIVGNEVINNGVNGIYVNDSYNVNIGSAIVGNVISGSYYHGISLFNDSSMTIYNNKIGLDINGQDLNPNGYYGIDVDSCRYITIGDSEKGNIIVGSGHYGIEVAEYSDQVTIQGNAIGTDFSGENNFANQYGGINLNNCSNILVGGEGDDLANIIAYNPYAMLIRDTTTLWQVEQNSFYCSEYGIYIDDSSDEITIPIIDSITADYMIYGQSENDVVLWIYSSDENCDECEGKTFLKKITSANTTWSTSLNSLIQNGDKITVIAENSISGSEFSSCFEVSGLSNNHYLNNELTNVLIYPNPVHSKLYIQAENEMLSGFELLSIQGNVLMKENCSTDKLNIDVSSFPSGIYFLKCYVNESVLNQKLIIER
jgi:parallel beta-helix repeat protein